MTHWYMWHDSLIVYARHAAYSIQRHDSLVYVTWLIEMCDMTHWYVGALVYVSRGVLDTVTWLKGVRDMTHWYSMRVTQRTRYSDMTHWYMWHDSLRYVTWLIDICELQTVYVSRGVLHHDRFESDAITHWCMWHDPFTCVGYTWHSKCTGNRLYHDMTHSRWYDWL